MESCCACLHIEYKPVEHDGGLKSDRWVCFDCNREFQRVPPSDRIAALEAQLAASEAARARLRESVRPAIDYAIKNTAFRSSTFETLLITADEALLADETRAALLRGLAAAASTVQPVQRDAGGEPGTKEGT